MRRYKSIYSFIIAVFLVVTLGFTAQAESVNQKQFVYDYAGILTDQEVTQLDSLANELGAESDTAFLVITANGTDGMDIEEYVGDFYDENAPGYDQPYGNTAILAIDLEERDIYLAGFKKAELYLNDQRLDLILESITPALSQGNYYEAFSEFISSSHSYMGMEPETSDDNPGSYPDNNDGYQNYEEEYYAGGNPSDNLFFQLWFQLLVSFIVGGAVVGILAYNSGGRVTVNSGTYMNSNSSKVLHRHDRYLRKTVTRVKKPTNNNNNSGGFTGGGGITGGGHSHSGSRGKF
ncbi:MULTISPECIES: TPM domain-containing protein [unclassified Sutcliffiella]|uniref:TPM domain-containing protein n=1 Tax=unclassified Sutcliffiella TaxID=2837532 RepID=UPI0030D1CEA8